MVKTSSKSLLINSQQKTDNKEFAILISFFQKNKNPVLLIKHQNFKLPQIVFCNQSFNEIFHYDNSNIPEFFSFISKFLFATEPVNILASEEIIKAILKKTGKVFQFIFHHIDNEYVFVEILSESNKLESLNLNENLNKEYYELVNLLPEVIFELNNDFTFKFLNETGLKIIGLGKEKQYKGIHIKEIISIKDYPQFETYLKSVFKGNQPSNKKISIKTKVGKSILLEVFFSVIKKDSKITGIRGIAINITNKHKLEKKLLQAKEKIEKADSLKTSFLMNMSHEIRTPLNSVLGFTQLLLRKINDPVLKKYLFNIKASGNGLLQLFNDLIDMSKIYADQLDIYISEVNLNKLIDKLFKDFQTEIEIRNKDIVIKTFKGLEDNESIIKTDEDRLKQIFISLFNNSLKFTETGIIEFGYQIADQNIHFYIKDTGKGMDKHIQEEIFDFFCKKETDTNGVQRGTGIGLAITKGIIKKINGKIWLESKPDKGTLVNFTLPNIPVKHASTEKYIRNVTNKADLSKKTILIVEDDPDNFVIIKSFCENTRARILHATNGQDAVNLCKNDNVNVVFMDINIPVMDGCKATRLIKESNKDIIIIAQSAYVMKEDKIKCYHAGCDAFIEKPINGEALINTLTSFLSRKN